MSNTTTNKLSNPLATAAILSNKEVVTTAKVVLVVAGVGTGLYFANRQYKAWRRQKFVEKEAHLPDVQAAMIMRKAMFRWGELKMFPFGTINIPDGTNETALNQIARSVTSVEAVIKAYKILFDSNLMLDVMSELNDSEIRKFFDSINSKGEYADNFNSVGQPNPQTPFFVGQTIKVLNPKGTQIFKAAQRDNGSYYNTGVARDYKKFDETVGVIIKVYKGTTSNQYFYVVDMHMSIDTIFGYGWVAHTEVKVK